MWPYGLSPAVAGGLTLPALVSLVKGHSSAGGWQLLQDGLDAWASLGWDKDFSFNVGKVLRTGAFACGTATCLLDVKALRRGRSTPTPKAATHFASLFLRYRLLRQSLSTHVDTTCEVRQE